MEKQHGNNLKKRTPPPKKMYYEKNKSDWLNKSN